jgi:hypothetical protein
MAWRALCGGAAAPGCAYLVEDGAGLSGELGPFGTRNPVAARPKCPVSDGDLAAGLVGSWAPRRRGRAGALVSVDGGFDVEGVMAPHGPACGRLRRRPDPADHVIRWVVGERGDPVGKGAVQGGVDLSQGGVELPDTRGEVGDLLQTAPLVLGEGCETLPKNVLRGRRLLHPLFAGDDPRLRGGERLTVVPAPAPAAGVVEPDTDVRQQRFGILAVSDGPT